MAYLGSSGLGSLRLWSRCPPGLQSSEGLAGAGGCASGMPSTPSKAHGSMGCTQSLPRGSLHKTCVSVPWQLAFPRMSDLRQKAGGISRVFSDLGLEVIFCHVILLETSQPTLKGELGSTFWKGGLRICGCISKPPHT